MISRAILFLIALLFAATAQAQTYSVDSITDGSFGDIVSAASGSSTFRAASSSGAVTRQSGSAVRVSTNSVYSVVTIGCSASNLCNSATVYVTLALAGTPTGRLGYIPSVNLTNGTATVTNAYSAGSYIVINLSPIPRNASRTFLLGYDVPVLGNDSGQPTGNAVSSFLITASRLSGAGSDSLVGNITAKVIRPIDIAKTADLQFGSVTRPSSGSGTLTLSPAGVASVTGAGVRRMPSPVATPAAFTVNGEGGQAVTVSVPATVTLSGSAGSVVATTSATGSGSQVLSGSTGGSGTVQVKVGGTIPLSGSTAIGTFTGTLVVTVQYN
ncbi:DUF4402 domain-containing protein [Novosphingobium sp. CECT 9465]|uniref:DUF4402 domain-containing protein n=1 Tax=Novosphingobium sp. CECT 9465 TaxID=2829794 RepID=UPI001E34F0C7|nr:DUF4402 domain-containing protein [Novosphingobium sp. CECT 9465]CAH0497450.1 hypothetical protein NVSP9465_02510 [Novosphingobium sp. CECT 9465]